MYKILVLIIILGGLTGCSEHVETVEYKGLWISKNYKHQATQKTAEPKNSLDFEALYFNENATDTVTCFSKPDASHSNFGFFKYDTYYVKFDDDNEAFIVYDYTTHELVFRDIKRKQTSRFTRVDKTKYPEFFKKYSEKI